MDVESEQIQLAVESLHSCHATLSQTVPVRETFQGQPVWEGTVHVFNLEGHPTATRAYAWSSAIEGSEKRRVYAVLGVGVIKTPLDAVRAAIVAEHSEAMTDPSDSRSEEVQILIIEYNTLRTELLQRNTTAFQAFGVGGTALVAIIAFELARSVILGFVLLMLLSGLVWFVGRVFDFDTRNAATRLRELEGAINDRMGSKLLAWETDYGLLSPGGVERRRQHIIGPIMFAWSCCASLVRQKYAMLTDMLRRRNPFE